MRQRSRFRRMICLWTSCAERVGRRTVARQATIFEARFFFGAFFFGGFFFGAFFFRTFFMACLSPAPPPGKGLPSLEDAAQAFEPLLQAGR